MSDYFTRKRCNFIKIQIFLSTVHFLLGLCVYVYHRAIKEGMLKTDDDAVRNNLKICSIACYGLYIGAVSSFLIWTYNNFMNLYQGSYRVQDADKTIESFIPKQGTEGYFARFDEEIVVTTASVSAPSVVQISCYTIHPPSP